MTPQASFDRRSFLQTTTTAAAAITLLPRHVMGGSRYVAPSDKIRVGYIGCGTQGLVTMMRMIQKEEIQITAVCDCNKDSQDYIEWGKHSIRNRIRDFLEKPDWGTGNKGCRAGREVGREVVDGYYEKIAEGKKFNKCTAYEDYREMIEKEDIDAVCVMTPEHTHATIAIYAMEHGKHVVMHKPISNIISEVRLAEKVALKTKVANHMFCASDQQATLLTAEWIQAGAIGQVREVHVWSRRPVWPQDLSVPKETPAIPEGFNWDLWLGPAEYRPFHPIYTHTNFRAWYDFGTGPLGDMGHYCFFQIWKILKLGSAVSVEASGSTFCQIDDGVSHYVENKFSFPRSSRVSWEFPARGDMAPVTIHWYDGGIRPPKPRELEHDGRKMPDEGVLYVGDSGKILTEFIGGSPRIIPESAMQAFERPPKTMERPIDEIDQWICACRGEQPADARFEIIRPINETLLLGTIGIRVPDKLYWDAENMQFTNSDAANELVYRKYREGWELPV